MPTYEYRCESCDYYFEKFQSIKDEPIKTCPKCGGPVKKLLSTGVGLIFKGSGFYETDYKHKHSSPPSNGHDKNNGAHKKTVDESKKTSTEKPKAAAAG